MRGQSADEGLAALDERQRDAERREVEATDRIAVIDERARALSDELASVEEIDPWQMADPLRRALIEAVATTERDTVVLELDAAEDRDAARALEATGRLPAARDARAAIDVLRGVGIAAVSGWDYLAESVSASDREVLLARLPELVGGVILTNPAHRERAETALLDAALTPTIVVALGDTSELSGTAAEARRARFIVAPHVALYDEQAGEDELEVRAERLAQVAERRRELDARRRCCARGAAIGRRRTSTPGGLS